MAAGMILILAAIALAALNIREDTEGEKAASQALDELLLLIPTAVVKDVPTAVPAAINTSMQESTSVITAEPVQQSTPTAMIYCQTGTPVLIAQSTTVQVEPTITDQMAVPAASPTALAETTEDPVCTDTPTVYTSEVTVSVTTSPEIAVTLTPTVEFMATPTIIPIEETVFVEPTPTMTPLVETVTPEPSLTPIFETATPAPTPTPAPAYIRNPYIEMPVVIIEGRYYIGVLELPTLGISLPVQTTWSESMLKASPCRYKGSAYTGDMIISGHNYTKHFSGLKNLLPGDEVVFTDANGNVFRYYVLETVIMDGTEVKRMERGSDEWDLTLFTCTYGGRSRLTVRCKEIK